MKFHVVLVRVTSINLSPAGNLHLKQLLTRADTLKIYISLAPASFHIILQIKCKIYRLRVFHEGHQLYKAACPVY